MKRVLLWTCVLLTGCHAGYDYRWGSVTPAPPSGGSASLGVSVSGPVSGIAGAVIIAVVLADGIRYYLRLPDGTRVPYEGVPDGGRVINVQDCTQAIDLTAGNLMCR